MEQVPALQKFPVWQSDEPPAKRSTKKELLDGIYVTKVIASKSLYARVEEELAKYRMESPIHLNKNPLIWWKQSVCRVPLISHMARKKVRISNVSMMKF